MINRNGRDKEYLEVRGEILRSSKD